MFVNDQSSISTMLHHLNNVPQLNNYLIFNTIKHSEDLTDIREIDQTPITGGYRKRKKIKPKTQQIL